MTTKKRTDEAVIGDMLKRLNDDIGVAREMGGLHEWGEAMAALSRYQAERMREIACDDLD